LAWQRCEFMKRVLYGFAILALTLTLHGQTNEPVRLALISESPEASSASDVLTAQISQNQSLQLLERDEIEKAYREQGLSAGNKDYLKLGQILGADGLLLLDVARTKQGTNWVAHLMVRLIAVKPGVIVTDGMFSWPLTNSTQYAELGENVSTYLNSFLPKLSLKAKDAIPISVVNLRSAISSAEGAETEAQLKLLTIQRLSQEKELFVLERQKMQLLSEEKTLKLDDSAFWNGSYLLEGVIDQYGYSKDTITVNARLTPPRGGTPLQFEVSGSRTNLSEVINHLGVKITELLKINTSVPEWNAADEASQYYAEAQWALRWGANSEAQAAADSAWALGKQDLGCAVVRVKSYMQDVLANVGALETMEETYGAEGGYDVNGKPVGNSPSEARIRSDVQKMLIEHPHGVAYKETQDEFQKSQEAKSVKYFYSSEPPDPRNIDRALHALELYYQFSRNSPDGAPKIIWRGAGWTDWHNSDWYQLGIDDLVAASTVLQNFNLDIESQKPVAAKLAELRALSRSVAGLISQSPPVHDSYFVSDRIATHDELSHTIEENPSIFRCKVQWGSFWQETPEADVALYRDLMNSPVFCYIHKDFWSPALPMPRLVAWNEQDRKRIPVLWNDFLQELSDSTNVLWQMEAKALTMSDASSYEQSQSARDALFEIIRSNRAELVANNVELFYLGWGLGYPNAELDAMDQEYWLKTVPAQKTLGAFEKQKEFLKANQPYDFMEFVTVFQEKNYSKDQALEIQPLIAAYKSNLVAQAQTASGMQKGQLMGAIAQVGFLENDVSRIFNPPAPRPQPSIQPSFPKPAPVVAPPISHVAPEIVTNIITVNQFFPIPLDRLYHLNDGEKISDAGASITAHHWYEGRLLLNFQYGVAMESRDGKGVLMYTRMVKGDAVAIFNPVTERWRIIDCPESDGTSHIMSQNNFYHRSALLHEELFTCDEKQIKKYDFQNQQWTLLSISDGNNYELFAVNGHLYAASQNTIFEITNGGKETHILASTRRQPPVSALDTEDLGTPTLFEGPGHSLRVSTRNKIFTWTGNDWREICAAPPSVFPPIISVDDVLFQSDGWNVQPARISRLATKSNQVEFCLVKKSRQVINAIGTDAVAPQVPLWKLPPELSLPNLSAAVWQSSLCLMVDHSEVNDIVDEQRHLLIGKKILPKEGYNAVLFYFSQDLPLPQKVYLKFDASAGCPPTAGIGSDSRPIIPGMGLAEPWMLFTTNSLLCGRELLESPVGSSELTGYEAGIWMIPLSKLDPAIAAQKQILLEQSAQAVATTERVHMELLAKYDLNHNGIIDPDEKETALDDPGFFEWNLNLIDTNHNGWLDPEELAYFDANHNKILESKEQAGIEIAQHLLAEGLLKKFDANGDGFLDRQEFNELVQSGPHANPRPMPGFSQQFPDDNHDGKIDLAELEGFLNQQLRLKLRPRRAMGTAYYGQIMAEPGRKVDARESFKAYVELYWQNSSTGADGVSPSPAQKVLSDEERQRVLQQLMQKRNAETPP
jgi:Ca2+-binding EF-hand superfamily protein